jgi:hypothetical protein
MWKLEDVEMFLPSRLRAFVLSRLRAFVLSRLKKKYGE